jgi:hypothetical protein
MCTDKCIQSDGLKCQTNVKVKLSHVTIYFLLQTAINRKQATMDVC